MEMDHFRPLLAVLNKEAVRPAFAVGTALPSPTAVETGTVSAIGLDRIGEKMIIVPRALF